jgi:hypothetical protein
LLEVSQQVGDHVVKPDPPLGVGEDDIHDVEHGPYLDLYATLFEYFAPCRVAQGLSQAHHASWQTPVALAGRMGAPHQQDTSGPNNHRMR